MDAFAGQAQEAIGFFGFRGAEYAFGLAGAPCEVRVSTDDGSMGAHALVTDLVWDALDAANSKAANSIKEQAPDLIMACGPVPMLHALQNLALRERIDCQISLEEYMACGLGACLVCSCKARARHGVEYRRVCVDGPVFDAREVCLDG